MTGALFEVTWIRTRTKQAALLNSFFNGTLQARKVKRMFA